MGLVRIVSLNLNHRTRPRQVPNELVQALVGLLPDVLVLNEFVEPEPDPDLRADLANAGLKHLAVSPPNQYAPGRWSNQLLVASKSELVGFRGLQGAQDDAAASNLRMFTTLDLRFVAMRAPAYTTSAEWRRYWSWVAAGIEGDLVIGDLNIDPTRASARDRELNQVLDRNWIWTAASGPWSYQGRNGTSRVDHVLHRPDVVIEAARYLPTPFVPDHTDHAVLFVAVRTPT